MDNPVIPAPGDAETLIKKLRNHAKWHRNAMRDGTADVMTEAADALAEPRRLAGERDAYKRDWQAELDGNAALRLKYGARDNETMFDFIERIAGEVAQLRHERDALLLDRHRRDGVSPCGHYRVFAMPLGHEDGTDTPYCMQCNRDQLQDTLAAAEGEVARLQQELGKWKDALANHLVQCPQCHYEITRLRATAASAQEGQSE